MIQNKVEVTPINIINRSLSSSKKCRVSLTVNTKMGTTSITISFSINYQTAFGEEVYVNLDDCICKKLTWRPGHIWIGSVTVARPRRLRWWYSIRRGDVITRVEVMSIPRTYRLTAQYMYYHVYDRWGYSTSSVSALTIPPLKHVPRESSPVCYSPKKSPYIKSILVQTPTQKAKALCNC